MTDSLQVSEISWQKLPTLPSGTLTFLFTDMEGSTRLWERYPDKMSTAMMRHDTLIESAVALYGGVLVRPRGEGDSRFAVFTRATEAIGAAVAIQHQFSAEKWAFPHPLRVRIALHTGEANKLDGDYYGTVVNRCARLRNVAYGGQILLSQATYGLAKGVRPEGVTLRDLGEYKLKDLRDSEHIYQVIADGLTTEFPPLKTQDTIKTNIPLSLTSFIGRESEVVEVKELISINRLLTISGSGGAGKTRLAIQAASELLALFPDGVWFVDLAPLSNADLIVQYIMNSIGIREEEDYSPLQTLFDYSRDKTLLLILDNCEHLLQGVAGLVESLLRGVPKLKVLATSREPLGILGEMTWCIPPLSSPDIQEADDVGKISSYEAVQLFVDRAKSVLPDFSITKENASAVAQICARLDGIPLAIELAAARVRALPTDEIATRLNDRFRLLVGPRTTVPRQKTLRNLIDWSYDLLTEKERIILRRLSVFSGDWNLGAAEYVCSGGCIEVWEVLDLLTHLVDKSLVIPEIQNGGDRYRFLETIRQYAEERLVESNEADEFTCRHSEYYLNMAEESYGELWGPNQADWLLRLESDHDNLRLALMRMEQDPNRGEMSLRMSGSLWRFWEIRGYISEGRAWLERALAGAHDASIYLRANGLRGAGMLIRQQGDYELAKSMHEQSLAFFDKLNDKLGIARELDVLGEIAQYQGEYSQAIKLHRESLALRVEIDDKEGIAVSLGQLGVIALDQGRIQEARKLLEESLSLNRMLGDKLYTALALNNLGFVVYHQCEYKLAISLFEEALAIYRKFNDQLGISNTLLNLGNVAKDQGELLLAINLYNECLSMKKELGDKRGVARVSTALAEVTFLQGKYYRAMELAGQSLTLSRNLGVKRGVIVSLILLSYIAHYQGDTERSRSLAQESIVLSSELDYPRASAYTKEVLGLGAYAEGDLKTATELLQETLAAFQKIDDKRSIALTMINLARTAYRQGDYDTANHLLDQSLSIARELETRWILGFVLEIKGLIERRRENFRRASKLFQESLHISAEQDNLQGIANCFGGLAGLAVMANQPTLAARLFAAAEKLRVEMGVKMGKHDLLEYDQHLATLRDHLDEVTFNIIWSEGYSMATDRIVKELTDWMGIALVDQN